MNPEVCIPSHSAHDAAPEQVDERLWRREETSTSDPARDNLKKQLVITPDEMRFTIQNLREAHRHVTRLNTEGAAVEHHSFFCPLFVT